MQRFLIITLNCVLLVFLLIGLPAATRARLGDWQISSYATGRTLMFWGLGIAAGLNLLAALMLIKGRKGKILCWEWAAIFGALLLAYYGFLRGYVHFDWLTRALQWMHEHL
jgi:hypothetical protein